MRAGESVTFRLTRREKALLDHLAELEGKTRTDLFRELIELRAREHGVQDAPEKPKRRGPGRPKTTVKTAVATMPVEKQEAATVERPISVETTAPIRVEAAAPPSPPPPPKVEPPPRPVAATSRKASAPTVGELADRFRDHFRDRAEGTRRELEQTLRFLLHEPGILDASARVDSLDGAALRDLRRVIKGMDLRFSKKNLHLTYLRMMLSFAVKSMPVVLDANPVEDLAAFTAKELADAWPGLR